MYRKEDIDLNLGDRRICYSNWIMKRRRHAVNSNTRVIGMDTSGYTITPVGGLHSI